MPEPFYSLKGPLDPTPTGQQMRAANLVGLPAVVRNLGGNAHHILDHFGLAQHTVRDPNFIIDCQLLADVLEHCSRALREPLFGIRLAHAQSPDVYGCVTAQCRAAFTFGDAVRSLVEYLPVTHAPSTEMVIMEAKHTTEIRWTTCIDGKNDQANYQAAALNLKLLRSIGGGDFRPSYVNLAVSQTGKRESAIENEIGCRFSIDPTTNAIAFATTYLEQPVPTADKLLFRLLGGYLDRIKSLSPATIADRVDAYIRGALPTGACSIEHCARQLGLSVRTLQTQLADASVQFSDLLDAQRREFAEIYLRDKNMSIDEVSALLGYSEQSSFGRAFKRWTGATPNSFRKSLRAK